MYIRAIKSISTYLNTALHDQISRVEKVPAIGRLSTASLLRAPSQVVQTYSVMNTPPLDRPCQKNVHIVTISGFMLRLHGVHVFSAC